MRLIKTILVLFLYSFLLNACKKDLSVDNTTNITSENGKIIIPDNFLKKHIYQVFKIQKPQIIQLLLQVHLPL